MSIRVLIDGYDQEFDPIGMDSQDRERIARDGIFLYPHGKPKENEALRQARAYFAGGPPLSQPNLLGHGFDDVFDEGRRWLIPDLWPWGTLPMLGGAPKVGKTTFSLRW